MTERAYTLKDIDRMRKCINGIEWKTRKSWSSSEDMRARERMLEDRLRTYMAGNVDPSEIYARYEELFHVTAEANFG